MHRSPSNIVTVFMLYYVVFMTLLLDHHIAQNAIFQADIVELIANLRKYDKTRRVVDF